jgi:hypothetical protein
VKGRWTPIIQTEVSDGLPVSGYANMALHPTGDYVQYDDYETLLARCDARGERIEMLVKQLASTNTSKGVE